MGHQVPWPTPAETPTYSYNPYTSPNAYYSPYWSQAGQPQTAYKPTPENWNEFLDHATGVQAEKAAKAGTDKDKTNHDDATEKLFQNVVDTIGSDRLPTVLVTFENLNYIARTISGTEQEIANYGNTLFHMLTFWRRPKGRTREILRNCTGSFRPGKSTLILGPPQSGKSSLMKAIAGRLKISKTCLFEGDIKYGGLTLDKKSKIKLPKLVGFINQVDLHMPTLTVRETMEFAQNCTARFSKKMLEKENFGAEGKERIKTIDALNSEITMATLGIRHVGDTKVGNENLRGVSGGQRKRLTTGEILVTRTPVVMADEISTGLDSATTLDICNALRHNARVLKHTVVVSLLQPTPETFNAFDELLVMAAGGVAYLGPVDEVLPYFEGLGFVCPKDKDTAEFLQEVTLPKGMRKYRSGGGDGDGDYPTTTLQALVGWDGVMRWVPTMQPYLRPQPAPPPRPHGDPGFFMKIKRPEDFATAWLNSEQFMRRMKEDMPLYEQSKRELEQLPQNSKYGWYKLTHNNYNNVLKSTAILFGRQVKLTKRNKLLTVGRIAQVVVMGLLLGTLFLQLDFNDSNLKFSVIFFSLLYLSIAAIAIIPGVVAERKVVYRQLEHRFYPAIAYAIGVPMIDFVLSIIEVVVFGSIVYWLVGLAPEFERFLVFLLIVFLTKISMTGLMKMLAIISPSDIIATGMASLVILVFIQMSGFILSEEDTKPYWIWAFWINPIQYGMTAASINEFKSDRYSGLVPGTTQTWGDFYLTQKKLPTDTFRIWLGVIYNACFYLLMVILYALALIFIRWPEKFPAKAADDDELEDDAAVPQVEIPFTPCSLSWHDIDYDVDDPGSKQKLGLRLLHGVSGYAKPKTMTALMGSSGAGKTTLLDVLAGRKNTGKISGDILLNGQTADPVTFSRYSGYVEQMDIHSPSMTVKEALLFSARLRLPKSVSGSDTETFVDSVMHMLRLEPIKDFLIGVKGNGLSVEQVKRVTIGVEMAANPSVIFLDEPTSGLDSMAADLVLDAIKSVCATGRTIICTIHQPSTYLFEQFHCLLLLKKGGYTVFSGETGEGSKELVKYFESVPGAPKYKDKQNPATWMLDVIATEGIDFAEAYQGSALAQENAKELETLRQASSETLSSGSRYPRSLPAQLKILLGKWNSIYWRSTNYNITRTLTCILIALVLGSIYWQIDGNDVQSTFSKAGAIYSAVLFLNVMHVNTIQSLVASERTVYYRENAANMYHPIVFNLAVGICELPYLVLNTAIFANVFWWMVGLPADAGIFFTWYLAFFLQIAFAVYFGLFLGTALPNIEAATGAAAGSTSIFSLLCGFMIPRFSIPWWWRWLHYGTPVTYTFQITESVVFYCAQADQTPSNPGSCPMITVAENDGTTATVAQWTYVKNFFDLAYHDRWWYMLILFGFVVITRVASGLALTYINHDKR